MSYDSIPPQAMRALAARGYQAQGRGDANCDCAPACPSCGGLECLCRPRFFAGQVLTEDDLNRLQNYVIAKNRLHNRHFHGPGVVCGLEVVCDACDAGSVTVKPGYAIAPCGDDIIVCGDTRVNICDLITRCRAPDNNCDPYGSQTPTECTEGIRQWVLSICYEEKPSRGVQPLMSEPCSCKTGGGSCGCGGGGSCGCGGGSGGGGGCGCGGGSKSRARPAASTSRNSGKYNAQCEPTLVCESYGFTATRHLTASKGRDSLEKYGAWGVMAQKAKQFGPLLTRIIGCYLRAAEIRDSFAHLAFSNNTSELASSYSEYLDLLRQFAEEHLAHRCELLKRLYQLEEPRATGLLGGAADISAAEWQARFAQLNALWLDIFRDCFCSALLPPCPSVESGNCVPIAVVTVDMSTCRVVEICNWQAREFSLTLPSLYYWTSFIDWGAIKDVIAKLCCESSDRTWLLIFAMLQRLVANNTSANLMDLNALRAGAPVPPATAPAAVAAAAAGTSVPGASAPAGDADPFKGSVPAATLKAMMEMLGEVTRPDGMARLLSVVQPPNVRAQAEVGNMREEITDLKRQVAEQATMINRLMQR